ncbi:MAG: VOC family protein [Candidatus Eremiobacteraeota bacterium]|nr:VOC family protein [Candidatus Eremiobacteraeota bacterium]MBV8354403.1 VOC family protein [Candidatus Eremiobacteraeota bacterium]
MDLAVHSLEHFALEVPDAGAGRAFYENFGLAGAADGNALRLSTGNGVAGFLYESAPRKRLHHLAFGIAPEERAPFKAHLETAGIRLLDAPKGIDGEALWFRDPDENLIAVASTQRRAPSEKTALAARNVAAGMRGAPEQGAPPKPKRMGHCLLFSTDVARSVAFYERTLGLRLSDRSGEIVAFMHTPHGSDHHILAFGRSPRPGFHHASFEMEALDDIGMAAMHMTRLGYREGWGTGRHYIGSNYFHYVRDPWGSFAEYFYDIDYIPAGCAWETRDVPQEFSLYVWGPPPPPYFFENIEEG